jgi:protease I
MPTNLNGKRVAILVTDGFEQVELVEPSPWKQPAGGQRLWPTLNSVYSA